MNWEKMFHVNIIILYGCCLTDIPGEGWGGGVLNKVLYVGGSALRSDPFSVYVLF